MAFSVAAPRPNYCDVESAYFYFKQIEVAVAVVVEVVVTA